MGFSLSNTRAHESRQGFSLSSSSSAPAQLSRLALRQNCECQEKPFASFLYNLRLRLRLSVMGTTESQHHSMAEAGDTPGCPCPPCPSNVPRPTSLGLGSSPRSSAWNLSGQPDPTAALQEQNCCGI